MPSKFQPITDLLLSCGDDRVTISFSKIEAMIGPLDPSARRYNEYWYESPTHTITHAWLRAGFVRESVCRTAETVVLRRDPVEATRIRQRNGVRM